MLLFTVVIKSLFTVSRWENNINDITCCICVLFVFSSLNINVNWSFNIIKYSLIGYLNKNIIELSQKYPLLKTIFYLYSFRKKNNSRLSCVNENNFKIRLPCRDNKLGRYPFAFSTSFILHSYLAYENAIFLRFNRK